MIQRQNFLDILKENSLDYENFCQIKDQILLYNNYDHLYLKCFVCKESNHPTNFCPFLRLNLSDQRILDKFNYSQNQERVLFERNLEKSKLYYVKKEKQPLVRNLSNCSSTSNHNESNNNEAKINLREKSSSRGDSTNRFMEEIDRFEDKKIMEEMCQNFKDSSLIKAKSLTNENELNHEESLLSRTENFPLQNLKMANNDNENFHDKEIDVLKMATIKTENDLEVKLEDSKAIFFEEIMKIHSVYFMHNNYDKVITKANQITLKKLKKKRFHRLKFGKMFWNEKMGSPENNGRGFSKLKAKLEIKTEKNLNKNNILAYLKRHEILKNCEKFPISFENTF